MNIWTKQYPEEIPASITYENTGLQDYLIRAAEQVPDKEAVEFLGRSWTYEKLYEEASAFAGALQNLGVEKGTRVAVMLANTPQSVVGYYGILLAGGIVVQTNPLSVERELEHQLVDSGAEVILCLDLVYPKVSAVKERTSLKHIIVTSISDSLPFPKNCIYPFIQKRKNGISVKITPSSTLHRYKELLQQKKTYEPQPLDPAADLALLQYTGGTTGPAKGVMLTHRNLVANTTQCMRWMYKIDHGNEVLLCALPFFHVYGMTVGMNFSIMDQSKMVILPKFDPEEVLKTIEKQKVTIFPGAPTMYIGLIHQPSVTKYDLSSIRVCISGSAPLPLEVQQRFEELTGGKLNEGYGLTEASPVTHFNLMWGKRPQGSIGLPWPDTEVRILSQETGLEAGPGEVGELLIRGPQVMQGYWKQPEETAIALQDGWLYTGDMGYMDEEGYFYIVDRKKDMIIAGGFNIYPREIEEVLYEHPDVKEAAAVGIPDPYRGETVKVFLVVQDGKELTEETLDTFCRERLAAYKIPRQYEFRTELPKTMVGKILRRALQEEEKQKER
ncbi:long-chain-fatty-acid--CoA ligase [Alkalicoccus urumqiensis]|uniref:Long-chain fatty acid--CoA ligase n=1 Tax=Alkalicoccus urumqiensis TaxID=1548213 RepID=A0A2P6MF91_ALKUR|nr:long-chain-fatty-acid--CoA ligase [Alkalicoccus urumqiensis]PRO64972.1 long-chain fatty acid--CoA ligase [Alkalicoccus urumqiensis]